MPVLLMFTENEELSGILSFDKQFLVQMGFQLFATLLLVLFLWKMLYNPVRNYLAARKERIAKEFADADDARDAAGKLKAEYEAKLAGFEQEREELMAQAVKRAHKQEAKILDTARKEAESLLTRAHTEIEREREKAADEMKRQMVELSILVSKQYIARAMDPAEQNKLLDEAISSLGDLTWSA